mgnify:CR=1 FL=1
MGGGAGGGGNAFGGLGANPLLGAFGMPGAASRTSRRAAARSASGLAGWRVHSRSQLARAERASPGARRFTLDRRAQLKIDLGKVPPSAENLVDGDDRGVTFASSSDAPLPGDWDGLTLGRQDGGSVVRGLTGGPSTVAA